jgi:aspartate carbamoyltransferase catalytic subunit
MKLLAIFSDVTFRLFAPPSLELPDSIAAFVRDRGHTVIHCDSAVEAVSGADVVYATRVQRERMTEELPPSLRGSLLDRAMLQQAEATDIVIMHPLPRDSRHDSYDLSPTVDDLPGLAIFHQTDNGIPVRMALFLTALGVSAEAVQMTLRQRPWDARLRWEK